MKQYTMSWDELEAMLDRVANDGWDMERARDWVKLWEVKDKRSFTREEFHEAASRCADDGFYQQFSWQKLDEVCDDIFGKEEK